MDDNAMHVLKKLHTAAIDARNGYQEGLKDSQGRGLSGLFSQMIDLHGQNADALERVLVESGARADDQGSFMSVVHEAIMKMRALFGGLGEGVLPGLIDGEERNLARYDEGLQALAPGPSSTRNLVSLQRERLSAKVAELKTERQEAKASPG
jgi:uncharacterized protein (TIGR02284 family)